MKLYPSNKTTRADVLSAKHRYGIWFGASLGFTFAIFAWGTDAYLLSRMNSFYPWLKFAIGTLVCILSGGFTGWLAAKFEKPFIALILWMFTAFIFAWLTVSLPLRIMPMLLKFLEPDLQGLLHYTFYDTFSTRTAVAYAWIGIFVSLAGLLQIPFSDTAVFSTSMMGKISPMLVCLILMGIGGTIIDSLNNQLLRSPIDAMNTTIQYSVDHEGQEISRADSRRMRLSSLRLVQEEITPERKLIVSSYDVYLERVTVLVRFQKAWVECNVIYSQPISCEKVGNP